MRVVKVRGFCPMGCGETLFVGEDGCVTCADIDCPASGAVTTLLEDFETEHIVLFDEDGFSIQHPPRERLNGELFDCALHSRLRAQDEMPVEEEGLYRVIDDGESLNFERLG